jgi:hypothetical protein
MRVTGYGYSKQSSASGTRGYDNARKCPAITGTIRCMLALVAVIGVIGTLATPWVASTVNERFKRRDLRESIKSDLEVWDKLPEGESKEALFEFIEGRVEQLTKAESKSGSLGKVVALGVSGALWIGYAILGFYSGEFRLQRNADGILQVHSDRHTINLMTIVNIGVLALISGVATGFAIGYYGIKWRSRRRRRQRSRAPKPPAQTG